MTETTLSLTKREMSALEYAVAHVEEMGGLPPLADDDDPPTLEDYRAVYDKITGAMLAEISDKS